MIMSLQFFLVCLVWRVRSRVLIYSSQYATQSSQSVLLFSESNMQKPTQKLLRLTVLPILLVFSTTLSADISGTIFRDFNLNGIKDSLEPGVKNIIVTAYDDAGAAVVATTATDGTYNLSVDAGTYRVEVTSVPSYLKPGTAIGGTTQALVSIVDNSATHDVSLNNVGEYCQANPDIIMTRFTKDGHAGVNKDQNTLLQYKYTDNGTTAPTNLLTYESIGSVYGVAHFRKSNATYVSAYFKRHSDLGPDGIGTIYKIDHTAGNTVSTFVDLGGTDPRGDLTSYDWNHDTSGYAPVGKIGIGDIELSDDETKLFAVNMDDRKLYVFDLNASGNRTSTSSYAIPEPCTDSNDSRPMGLGFNDGLLYVGVTCTAESTVTIDDPDDSYDGPRKGDSSKLSGHIYSFNPGTTVFSADPLVDIPLDYGRGCIYNGDISNAIPPVGCAQINDKDGVPRSFVANWLPWQMDYDVVFNDKKPGNVGNQFGWNEYPQPLLSDIEFDNDGSMIILIRDVNGDRAGYQNNSPNLTDTTVQNGNGMGDIIRACGNHLTGWSLEKNASCGGITTDGEDKKEGLGGGEYYWFDNGPGGNGSAGAGTNGHADTVMGGLLHVAGHPDVVTGAMDVHDFLDNGLIWLSNETGEISTDGAGDPKRLLVSEIDQFSFFGKASGLGDLEALCDPAPIEIGNYVWDDSNGDGIQNPSETALSGVTVTLYEGATSVGSTTTDGNGEYYFGGLSNTNMTGGLPLKTLTDYQLRIDLTDTQLGVRVPTQLNINSNTDDVHDSDGDNGILNTGFSTIAYTTGLSGVNDHTLDFGFVAANALYVAIGNKVWIDNGAGNGTANNGIKDGAESGVDNVVVELRKQSDDSLVASTTTNGTGHYQFDNQFPDEYYIQIPAIEFGSGKPLVNLLSSTGAGNGDADETVDENGIDDATPASNGIRTAAYTLSVGGEPSGEATQAAYTGSLPDNSVNMTADFGFVELVAIGNKVWIDNGAGNGTANNGIKDGTESGVDKVKVELRKQSDDSLVASTITNSSGHYQFDSQLPGEYYINIPATEFGSGKPLVNLLSSTGAGNGDTDETVDENGIDNADPASNGIRTAAYTLSVGGEPSGEATQTAYTGNLPDNSVNMTADFGFVELVAIGNKVWIDNGAGNGTANNGIKDGTESGVDNVAVELRKQSDDSLVASTTTNGTGHYQFDNQFPGEYYIKIPATEFGSGKPLVNLLSSTGAGSGDADETVDENGIDDANPATNGIRTSAYTLSVGGEPTSESTQSAYTGTLQDNSVNMTADLGFVTVGMSLGDFIWWDVDGNGTQGGTGETGIELVKVELFAADGSTPAKDLDGTDVPFQTTGTDGLYLFTNLQAGDYVVQITPPVGYQLTTGGADPDDDSNTDSNGYVTGAGKMQSHPVTLSVNSEPDNDGDSDKNSNLSVDFGLLKYDLALRKKVDSVSDTPLIPGTSTVTFEIEVFNQGDVAASGIQIVDYIRTGFSYDSADNTAAATGNTNDWSTAANPTLIIPGPIAAGGSATVKIVLSVDADTHGQKLTNAAEIFDDGSNTDIDSVPDNNDGNDVTVDDEIDNTGGDEDDYDIASIQVETFDLALRKKVDSQSHPVLIPGTSTVTFAIEVFNQGDVNAGDIHIIDYIMAGFTYDAAANTAALTGNAHDWSAGPDPDLLIDTLNAGQSKIVKIVLGIDTGTVGQTLDNFAEIADDGETAGTDVDSTADATNSEDPVKDNEITEDGKNNVADDEDDHDVAMVTVEGFDLALRKKVGTLSDDPLIAGSSQVTFTIEVINQGDVAASDITLVDYIQTGFSYDPAENTAAKTGNTNNWSADADPLLVIPGPIAANTSTTVKIVLDVKADAAGQTITNVAEIADDNQAVGTDIDSTPDSNNTENPVKDDVVNEDGKNTSGDDEDDHDIANVIIPGARVAIGNTVWIDDGAGSGIENNGIKDGSEAGINGVVVELRKQSDNSLVDSTTTNPAGHYQFDEQLPGTYYVKIPASQFGSGQLLESRQSSTGAGIGNSDEDSDENGIDNLDPASNGIRSMAYTLSVGGEPTAEITQSAYTGNLPDDSVNMTVDFGFYTAPKVHIGNLVWIEDDNNGDATDGVITFPPVGTIVTATASDGNTTYTGTTDVNGLYDIEVPANDTYVVTVTTPSGTVPTAGSTDNAVPDATTENNLSHDGSGTTVVVEIVDNFSLDFGFTPPAVQNVHIGNLVWIEDDNNGDATDGVIAFPPSGTIVTATASDGQTTYTGITDASGLYDIEVPANDTYMVTVATPSGTVPTAGSSDNAVPDETAENNLTHDGSGTTVIVTTIDNFTLDFGFTIQSNAGVTGVVWFDTDKDGVKDPDENGLPGWTIEIIDSNGTPVQSLTTLPDGTFSDLNLGVGDFTIRFLSPGGIIIKEQTITLNPGDVAFVPEPIDPAGIVYDEQTGNPIPGAQVFLTNNGTPLPAACLGVGEQGQVTGVDGAYNFFLNPGADPACPATDTVYGIQVIPPTNYLTTVNNPPQAGVLDSDNCTIDAIAGVTCEVSDQTVTPITGIPPYFIEVEIGIGDPGVFNNHIPLTPPNVVVPPTPGTPVKPIPTLSEWGRIILMLFIGMLALMQQGRRRREI